MIIDYAISPDYAEIFSSSMLMLTPLYFRRHDICFH